MLFRSLVLGLSLIGPQSSAQSDAENPNPAADARSATGGAQTLEDILARQRGEKIDDSFRSNATGDPDSAAGIANQLGTLGGVSDPELWRALRYGTANVTASNEGVGATTLVQDGGMRWMTLRDGPLRTYGGNLLRGTRANKCASGIASLRTEIDDPIG